MRKLAAAAIAFSAAVFLANYILPLEWLLVPAVLAAAGAAVLAALREKWLKPLVIMAAAFSLGLLNYYVQYRMTAGKAEALEGQTQELTLRLASYPVTYDDYCRAEAVLTDDNLPGLKAIIYDNNASIGEAIPGQTLRLTAKISAANQMFGERYDHYYAKDIYLKLSTKSDIGISGGFDARYIPQYINHALGKQIDGLFPEDTSGFMKSLLMGDKADFYENEEQSLSLNRAGLSHTIAVSGMHIAFLTALLRLLLGSSRRSSILCISLIWLFTLITGAGPSTVRAAVMQTMLLTAPIVYRENDTVTSLSAALALILAKNPLAAKSVSLQLSFAAMAGILCFAERIYEHIVAWLPEKRRRGAGTYILGTVSTSVAVSVFTVPLTALHFGYISILSMLSNLAALWAVSLCFCMGWICCVLSLMSAALAGAGAWLCAWLARYILFIARFIAKIPFAVLYTRTQGAWLWLAGAYAAFTLFLHFKLPGWLKALTPAAISAAALLLLLASARREYEGGMPTVSVIDVGQGQSIAAFCNDSTIVIDCGMSSGFDAGERTGEYLISCGREKIDLLFLTHLHRDHANGVPMLMEMLEVDTLILPENTEQEDELYEKILSSAKKHETEVIRIAKDAEICCGGIYMQVYALDETAEENQDGLMAKLSIGDFDTLITGDSSTETEQRLINSRDLSGIDLLVVGHHGSNYASGKYFLDKLGARDAVISVGYNIYGHPADKTLERLANSGYTIYRTDLDGTVEFRIAKSTG